VTLPPLYDRWMTEALGAPVRGEPASTCSDCAMCPKHPAEPEPHFRPDVKCCGFRPTLPNFLVGAILQDDEHPEGRRTIRQRLGDKIGVTPLGVAPSPEYAQAHKDSPFGSDPELICPHFTLDGGGTCTIWAHREAVCATWFCRVERGAVGNRFWMAQRGLLDALQQALARDAASALGAEPPHGWGRWAPRDEAFFVACAEHVRALSWDRIRALGGFVVRVRLRELRDAFAAREQPALPDHVHRADVIPIPLPDGRVRLRPWSRYDALDLPPEVIGRLPEAEVATAHLLAQGVFDRATLQRLVDHAVLVPGGDDDPFAALSDGR
jgi:hypothetical protein